MDLKTNKLDSINHVRECINTIHSIFDYYVSSISQNNTTSSTAGNTSGSNDNRNTTSVDFDRQLSNRINSLDNRVDELTNSKYVTKNKLDNDKIKPEKLKQNQSKKDKMNKSRMELQLNYLNYLKEYYVCYLNHFVTVYSNYYVDNNEVNNKLVGLFGFLKRLSLLHIKLVLESIPDFVKYSHTYFESVGSITLISLPCSTNITTSGSGSSKDSNTTGGIKDHVNKDKKEFLNHWLDTKPGFSQNLMEEFVKYLTDNGFAKYGFNLMNLIRNNPGQQNPTFVKTEQYQKNLHPKLQQQALIFPNNFNLNKMN